MATSLPYLSSYKNVDKLFSGIAAAKVPESFTQAFLAQTLGLKASSDRPLIPLMRSLGFIDTSGRPTPAYRELKNSSTARGSIAAAIRRAYAPLFAANEAAHTLASEQLRGLVSQVAGTDEEMTKRIAYTFSALVKSGDFNAPAATGKQNSLPEDDSSEDAEEDGAQPTKAKAQRALGAGLRTDFHYNLQIHLPANGTEETYLNIFNALRKIFQ